MFGRRNLVIAALGALAFLGWGAPSRVQASCGDYVVHGHNDPPMPNGHSETRPLEPSSPCAPCHGPQCKSHQDPSPVPPSPPVPTGEKLWVNAFELAPRTDDSRRRQVTEARLQIPARNQLSIFHPPRS